jgi:hypothetical protein
MCELSQTERPETPESSERPNCHPKIEKLEKFSASLIEHPPALPSIFRLGLRNTGVY